MKTYYVYILSSEKGVLYTGMTNDLFRRVEQHKKKARQGFTSKYVIFRLVHFEEFNSVHDAIFREKQVKSWRREKHLNLIRESNPNFEDLSLDWQKS